MLTSAAAQHSHDSSWMSGSQLAANSTQSHSLSDEASSILCRIPQLLRCLRELEDEEARLNAQARQLLEPQVSTTKDRLPTGIVSTPVSKPRFQGPGRVVNGDTPPPAPVNPGDIQTPVKTLLLMQSLALPMSVKSKRKGRVFLGGGSTEVGERK